MKKVVKQWLFGLLYMLLSTNRDVLTKESYKGFQVLSLGNRLNTEESTSLHQFQSDHPRVDFWPDLRTSRGKMKVFCAPEDSIDLKQLLQEIEVDFSVETKDLSQMIVQSEGSYSSDVLSVNHTDSNYTIDWYNYHSHEGINQFLDELSNKYDFVEVSSIGRTFEGRDMKILKTTKAGKDAPNVFFEAGIHAREWISPAVATFLLHELIENEEEHPDILDNVNIHMLPVTNPDGYEHSRDHDRLWRKNRNVSTNIGTESDCIGVDLNRNFPFHWGEASNDNPCFRDYHGAEPLSEVELQNLVDYYLALDPQPIMSISFHSYGPFLLYPYSYVDDTYPENVEELIEVGKMAVDALNQVNQQNFSLNNAVDGLYLHSGTSYDWYASLGSRFVYSLELRDEKYGFLLPKEHILPSGRETWAAIHVMLEHVRNVTRRKK